MIILIALFLFGNVVVFGAAKRDERCPLLNTEFVIYLPHDTDCTLFYKCDWGNRVLFSCPPGFNYNPKSEACDWPESAGYESKSGSNLTPSESPVEGQLLKYEQPLDQEQPLAEQTIDAHPIKMDTYCRMNTTALYFTYAMRQVRRFESAHPVSISTVIINGAPGRQMPNVKVKQTST